MAAAPPRPFRSVFLVVVLIMGIVHVCPDITNAAPVTRSRLQQDQQAVVTPEIASHQEQEVKEEILVGMDGEEGVVMKRRMVRRRTAVELDDYPGSGANNRHTPRQQFGRCVDC